MRPKAIRNIHLILSGAFAAAVRWEWIDRNPADSAKLPKASYRPPASPSPEEVAKVVAPARETDPALSVYLWLAAVTGAGRGELCGLQWADVDLDPGTVRVAFSYLVRDGQRLRKDTKTHQERTCALPACYFPLFWRRRHRFPVNSPPSRIVPTCRHRAGRILAFTVPVGSHRGQGPGIPVSIGGQWTTTAACHSRQTVFT